MQHPLLELSVHPCKAEGGANYFIYKREIKLNTDRKLGLGSCEHQQIFMEEAQILVGSSASLLFATAPTR